MDVLVVKDEFNLEKIKIFSSAGAVVFSTHSGDIGSMNTSMNDMRGDMKRMSRNVGRLSHDAQNLREPFRGMMPW